MAYLFGPTLLLFAFTSAISFDFVESLEFLFESLFFSIVVILPVLFVKVSTLRNIFLAIVIGLIWVKIFFSSIYYYLFKSFVTASSFFVLFETNRDESAEFWASNLDTVIILLLISSVAILWKAFFYFKCVTIEASSYLIGAILISLSLWFPFNSKNLFYVGITGWVDYITEAEVYKNSNISNAYGSFENVVRKGGEVGNDEFHVIIIGESTCKDHMKMYGYERNTTPLLDRMEGELEIYTDVISPHTHTIPVLSKVLTQANYENQDKRSGTIMQLLNQAGYTTYWLSNQQPVGLFENQITRMARATKEQFFINLSTEQRATPYDEELLPVLKKIGERKEEKVVVFVHLLGTHTAYDRRFPESFERFDSKPPISSQQSDRAFEIINDYDNAVLYNDFVVSNFIGYIKQLKASSFVLYFSDHGEDVYQVSQGALHVETAATSPMYRIPFLLWMSDAYQLADDMEIVLDRKYMTDDLFYGIAQLCGVDFDGFSPELSVFSTAFQNRSRKVSEGLEYQELLQHENE